MSNNWAEIRNEHFVTEADMMPDEGDILAAISIDAWKTDKDWEEGSVIAHVILSLHGDILVSYHDNVARLDASAQASIAEAKEHLRAYWNEQNPSDENQKCNTKFSYMYRDGANYKSHYSCVFKGAMTEEERRTFSLYAMFWGEHFIPACIGLCGGVSEDDDYYDPDIDGPFCEHFFENSFEATSDHPTEEMDIHQFIKAFVVCSNYGWENMYVKGMTYTDIGTEEVA